MVEVFADGLHVERASVFVTLGREEGRYVWIGASEVCQRGSSSLSGTTALSFPDTRGCAVLPDVSGRSEGRSIREGDASVALRGS